jgi:short subunit fatty acids transporter
MGCGLEITAARRHRAYKIIGDVMKISTETVGRLLASGRGYAQWIVGFATSLGLLSAANSKGLSDGFSDIFSGIAQTVHGFTSVWQIGVVVLGPIAAVVLAKWSSNTAKTDNQAAAVKAAVIDPNTPITPQAKSAIVAAATEVTKS